jgi:1,2-diacylglycerol 3-alpha-glucosyltransferase
MVICIVFSDIGHYHHARFTAAASMLDGGLQVVEVGGQSSYDEFKSTLTAENSYRLQTLFPGTRYVDVVSRRGVDPQVLKLELVKRLTAISPDILVLKGYSFLDSLFALQWAQRTRTPVVVMSESHAGDFDRRPWKEWLKRQLLADVSAALVGGAPHARYMHSLGIPKDRIFVGYDAVDNAHFAAGAEKARGNAAALRQEHGLPDRYILASGRFMPKKDFATLLRAFALYHQQAANHHQGAWELVILGDGPERANLESLRAELGLQDVVHLPGFRDYDTLPVYYGLAELFVHPSQREQWGLVVNEAMAAGLPVLVTNKCGCAEDLVLDGKTGFQFTPGNADELAARLLELYSSEEARSSMGLAARQLVDAFSPAAFARGLGDACKRAVESPRWGFGPWQRLVTASIIRKAISYPVDENLT